MKFVNKTLLTISALTVALSLSACNTIKGVGNDAVAAGQHVKKVAVQAKSDMEITKSIYAKIKKHNQFMNNKIVVSTVHGKVTLSGALDNESERRDAVYIARMTSGVKHVIDHLTII